MKLKSTRSTNQLSSDRALARRKEKAKNGGFILPQLPKCKKIEIYNCGNHESVVALNLFGKKPKSITCPVCKGISKLTLITTDPDRIKEPTFEWAQPPVEDVKYMPTHMRNYFITGGLYLRSIPKTETPT